jgi:hypothetical protein
MNELNPIDAGQGESTSGAIESPATPGVESPASSQPSTPSQVADSLYEVKVGNRTLRVPLSELTNGYSRHQDYTQKTMALAEERRQIQAQMEQERTQLRSFLSDRQNVQQLLDYLATQQGNAPTQPGQPTQGLTPQQLQAALAAERARSAQDRQSLMEELEMKQTEAGYRRDLDGHIATLLSTHPELKSIRGIDRILKSAAAEQDPATIDDAKALMTQVAAEQVDAIKAHFTEAQKQIAIQKTQLTARGTEPPGGAAPMPPSKSVGRMGSPAFNADVATYFQQLTEAAK